MTTRRSFLKRLSLSAAVASIASKLAPAAAAAPTSGITWYVPKPLKPHWHTVSWPPTHPNVGDLYLCDRGQLWIFQGNHWSKINDFPK